MILIINDRPINTVISFGEFEIQKVDLSLLGTYNDEAVRIFGEIGWQ